MGIKTAVRDALAHVVTHAVPPGIFRDKRYFKLWQSRGYHISDLHFYEPIPDIRTLKDDLWNKPSAMVGIDMNVERQLALLDTFARYKSEYEGVDPITQGTPDWEVLYCMVRHFKPRRMIEVGSGVSTRVAALALEKNRAADGIQSHFIAIEPYPNAGLRAGFPGLSELKQAFVQDIPCDTFQSLQENDILFIDSSHVLKIGSDVHYEYLEILPRISPGVIVHIHDIFFPFDYRRDRAMERGVFWNEQYLLQAFLTYNTQFQVLFSNSYLHHRHPDALQHAFHHYNPQSHQPGSFWTHRIPPTPS